MGDEEPDNDEKRRGGKGITAMVVNERNGSLVASFPVEETDQIMLVTDAGKLIRCPVDDVRIAGRSVQGVRIFKTEEAEKAEEGAGEPVLEVELDVPPPPEDEPEPEGEVIDESESEAAPKAIG